MKPTWPTISEASIRVADVKSGSRDTRAAERASRRARNRSTVNGATLNHAQHVLCDVSMLLGKCAQRGSP